MSCKGAEMKCCEFKSQPNNAVNADSPKRRAVVAPFFTTGLTNVGQKLWKTA